MSNEVAGELGPLKYLSGLTGIPMDEIINYLLLTIIFVFDPLAIALVIAANFAFAQLTPKTKENLYGEVVEVKEDEKPTFEIEEEDILSDLTYGQEDEDRMDVIGQNGNDGEHYEEEIESYAESGYMKVEQPSPLSLTFAQEAEELNKIMGKDLTQEQMQKLKDSKLTRTFNDENDDLKIYY
jgi:hypothetical protein